jgi:hypothetical protein
VKIVLYRLEHAIRPKLMVNFYNVSAFTIQKHTYIMCEILADKDNFFKIYIHLPTWQHLLFIIERFIDLIGIQQIASVIDDTHVPLSFWPSNKIMLSLGDFYNRKHSFNMVT